MGPPLPSGSRPYSGSVQADRPLMMDIHNLKDGAQSNAPVLGNRTRGWAVCPPLTVRIMANVAPQLEHADLLKQVGIHMSLS